MTDNELRFLNESKRSRLQRPPDYQSSIVNSQLSLSPARFLMGLLFVHPLWSVDRAIAVRRLFGSRELLLRRGLRSRLGMGGSWLFCIRRWQLRIQIAHRTFGLLRLPCVRRSGAGRARDGGPGRDVCQPHPFCGRHCNDVHLLFSLPSYRALKFCRFVDRLAWTYPKE